MTSNQTTRLLLVRHGQSEWNAVGRWQGQANSPLSDLGRKQAFSAAENIGSVDVIVSSPQDRALNSALIISDRIGVGPVQVIDAIRERSAGEWSGLTHAEIEEKWPGWIEDGRRPEGFESDESLEKRVFQALNELVAEWVGADILAMCHGGVINLIKSVLGSGSSVKPGRTGNLSGLVIVHSAAGFRLGDELELLPDTIASGGTSRHVV